jgi:two-component system response regulator RegA
MRSLQMFAAAAGRGTARTAANPAIGDSVAALRLIFLGLVELKRVFKVQFDQLESQGYFQQDLGCSGNDPGLVPAIGGADPRATCLHGLLVDDDALYLRTLQRSLQKRGLSVAIAQDSDEALAAARAQAPDFALIDLKLERESGLDLIGPLRALYPAILIFLVTGYASVATAVEAMKRGADNYLLKPTTVDAILRALLDDAVSPAQPESTMTPLSRLEWEHIQQALNETNGNISAAARLLGMHRRSLQRKLAKRPGQERKENEPF